MYYLILTPTLTLTPQLSPNPNRKPHIKCARMNIEQCSFSLCTIIFSGEIDTSLNKFRLNRLVVQWLSVRLVVGRPGFDSPVELDQ